MTIGVPVEIPLVPAAQRFSVLLNEVTYIARVHWCDPSQCWVMDLADSNDVPILSGVPLITGADLLAQFAYLGIAGQMVVQTDTNVDAVPTYTNLGGTGHLYFLPSE